MDRRHALQAAMAAPFLLHPSALAGQRSKELVERAPVFGIILDNSSDAPAWVPGIRQSAARDCRDIIMGLPMASKVFIMIAGDARQQVPELHMTRVQARLTRNGGPNSHIAAQMTQFILEEFPKRSKPDDAFGSSILLALRDGNRLLNPGAATNRLYLVTDGLERSSLANCYRDCRLPKPDFKFPANTRIEAVGWGLNLSDRESIALFQPWQRWFKDAGAGELMLYRTR